jgi:hypothetical protein
MPGSPAMSVGEGSYTVQTGLFVAIHFVGPSKRFEWTWRNGATNRAKR